MGAAFTAVGTGAAYDPFSLSIANEIVLAYSERAQAIGHDAVPNRVAGDDAHSVAFWATEAVTPPLGMQTWIETYYGKFINHDLAVAGNFDTQASIPVYTLTTFRAVAGLNASGFRRLTTFNPALTWANQAFSYGKAEVGDIFGPWIYEDLQKAFIAMKWTTSSITTGEYEIMQSSYGQPRNCGTATTQQAAGWPVAWSATSWKAYMAAGYLRYTIIHPALPIVWTCTGFRQRHRAGLTVPTFSPVSIGIHYYLVTPTFKYTGSVPSSSTYQDLDGYGAEDTMKFWEEYAEDPLKPASRGGASEATWFGDYTTNPVSDLGIGCPNEEWLGAQANGFRPVFKWNFTNDQI